MQHTAYIIHEQVGCVQVHGASANEYGSANSCTHNIIHQWKMDRMSVNHGCEFKVDFQFVLF